MDGTLTQIREKTIRKLIDYVLINACSINSTGLNNGKAGFSVTLFELSRILKDDYIEEQSLELLQESLLTKDNDIGFENGLSGVGFSLLYLITNKFINADFYDLFDESINKIFAQMKLWKDQNQKEIIFNNISVVYFLDCLWRDSKSDLEKERCEEYIDLFCNTVNDKLKMQFDRMNSYNNVYITTSLMGYFEKYLKLIHTCSIVNFSDAVIDRYLNLYIVGRLASSFSIGHYLNGIALEMGHSKIKNIAEQNMKYAIRGINPRLMTITEKTNLLFLLSSYEERYFEQINLLENGVFNFNTNVDIENCLLKEIYSVGSKSKYNPEIIRYLLYWVFKKYRDSKMNYERFNKIF